MQPQPVQIFMSYAWKDNTLPPDDPSAEKGFATLLWEQIDYEFEASDPKPLLWQDRNKIDDGQQFNPIIEQEIARSSLFLAVLSNHWLASEYCQRELKLFRERWGHEDDYTFGHRIILAHKTLVPEDRLPKIFPIQRGFRFFSISADGTEHPFHRRGRGNTQFFSMAGNLGQVLAKHARHKEPPGNLVNPPAPQPRQPTGRKIFLAKPAPDMRADYLRLHKELTDEGYNVEPPASAEIPLDTLVATKFIDDALAGAEASVHVLGKSAGHAPADLEPIVRFQLAKTAEKISMPNLAERARPEFRRIIWAPRIFEDAKGQTFERDPIDTFKSFGRQLPGDRVEGDSISPFVEFLIANLGSLGEQVPPPPLPSNGQIYLCHDETDTRYAIEVAELLDENNISYVMPVYYNTSELERRRFHKASLSECSAVMMCWANASELWARAQSRELRSWQMLGRKEQFACRGLIAGPPPDARKEDKLLRHLFPPKDIDIVFNWTAAEKPPHDAFRSIFSADTTVLR
jgi:TIR domain